MFLDCCVGAGLFSSCALLFWCLLFVVCWLMLEVCLLFCFMFGFICYSSRSLLLCVACCRDLIVDCCWRLFRRCVVRCVLFVVCCLLFASI